MGNRLPASSYHSSLQRGRARESAEIRNPSNLRRGQVSCFNGAALGRARRFAAGMIEVPVDTALQRGRARESAEILGHAGGRPGTGKASTGPRSGERGDVGTGTKTAPGGDRFNGAALGRARRCSLVA